MKRVSPRVDMTFTPVVAFTLCFDRFMFTLKRGPKFSKLKKKTYKSQEIYYPLKESEFQRETLIKMQSIILLRRVPFQISM